MDAWPFPLEDLLAAQAYHRLPMPRRYRQLPDPETVSAAVIEIQDRLQTAMAER